MVGVAQTVGHVVVGAVGGPAVVDTDTAVARQDVELVDRHAAASAMKEVGREGARRRGVHPAERARDPGAGLVQVQRRAPAQCVARRCHEAVERGASFCDERGGEATRHADPAALLEDLSGALDGQVLGDDQVGEQGPDPGSVTGRADRLGRERRGRLCPAPAAPRLSSVLGDDCSDLWKVEDLADLLFDELAEHEPRVAARAALGRVDHDVIGMLDRLEAVPLVAGLLAGAATPRSSVGRDRRLREPLGRGRHRGVLRVAREHRLELRDAILEGRHRITKPGVLELQSLDLSILLVEKPAQCLDVVVTIPHEE